MRIASRYGLRERRPRRIDVAPSHAHAAEVWRARRVKTCAHARCTPSLERSRWGAALLGDALFGEAVAAEFEYEVRGEFAQEHAIVTDDQHGSAVRAERVQQLVDGVEI